MNHNHTPGRGHPNAAGQNIVYRGKGLTTAWAAGGKIKTSVGGFLHKPLRVTEHAGPNEEKLNKQAYLRYKDAAGVEHQGGRYGQYDERGKAAAIQQLNRKLGYHATEQTIRATQEPGGGASIHPTTGHEPTAGYAVAQHGSDVGMHVSKAFVDGHHTPEFEQMVRGKIDSLPKGPKDYLGSWHDPSTGRIEVNHTKIYTSRNEAVTAGRTSNQKEIWDIKNGVGIQTGGTGEGGVTLNAEEFVNHNHTAGRGHPSGVMNPLNARMSSRHGMTPDEAKVLRKTISAGLISKTPLSQFRRLDRYESTFTAEFVNHMHTPGRGHPSAGAINAIHSTIAKIGSTARIVKGNYDDARIARLRIRNAKINRAIRAIFATEELGLNEQLEDIVDTNVKAHAKRLSTHQRIKDIAVSNNLNRVKLATKKGKLAHAQHAIETQRTKNEGKRTAIEGKLVDSDSAMLASETSEDFVNHNHTPGRGHPNAGAVSATGYDKGSLADEALESAHKAVANRTTKPRWMRTSTWQEVKGPNFTSETTEELKASPYAGNPKSIGGRSPSLKWPHLYDLLVAKGMDNSSAAAISNSRVWARQGGQLEGMPYSQVGKPGSSAKVLKAYQEKHGIKK